MVFLFNVLIIWDLVCDYGSDVNTMQTTGLVYVVNNQLIKELLAAASFFTFCVERGLLQRIQYTTVYYRTLYRYSNKSVHCYHYDQESN